MPSSRGQQGCYLGTRKIRCPLFWSDVPSQSRQAVPTRGRRAGRPSAPGRGVGAPLWSGEWAQLRFEVKCGRLLASSEILVTQGTLGWAPEGVPGSKRPTRVECEPPHGLCRVQWACLWKRATSWGLGASHLVLRVSERAVAAVQFG